MIFVASVAVFCSFTVYRSGATQTPDRVAAFREQERKALAEPFRGVTTDGRIVPGLFKVKPTGVSTKPVREAADEFIGALRDEQRPGVLYSVDDQQWRRWDNRSWPPRQGIAFREMSQRQRALAFELLHASLSAKGLEKTLTIMKLNETLAELTKNFDEYGEGAFWITVMGQPSDTEPWGWQLDGHHCVINYFVLGNQVVMTPTFMGAEPVHAESGKYKGAVALQEEQNKGLRLFLSLTKDQQAQAVIRSEKGRVDSLAQAYQDNLVMSYAGISASMMDTTQKKLLLGLIEEYVSNMKEGHARVRMEEVRSHLDRTYFSWIGTSDPNAVFYYRIQSPVILIEFDHQGRAAPVRTDVPTREHIHTVVRTPNGNDYGKDLLRQHHERHSHKQNGAHLNFN
jgi:hypothetical protein